MAYDKVIDSTKLDTAMTATADAIRAKTGGTANLEWNESTGFKNAVEAIEIKSDPKLQEKSVTPTTSAQSVTPDSGYDGLSKVKVDPIPDTYVEPTDIRFATSITPATSDQIIPAGTYCEGAQRIKGDSNLVASNIKSGVSIFGVLGTLASGAKVVTGTVTVSTQNPYGGGRIIRLYDIGINPKMVMFYMPDMIPSTLRQYFVVAMIADTANEECIAIRRNKSSGEISSYLGAAWCEADDNTTNIWSGEEMDEEVHCYASTYNYIAFV